jgi:hypothetical protein
MSLVERQTLLAKEASCYAWEDHLVSQAIDRTMKRTAILVLGSVGITALFAIGGGALLLVVGSMHCLPTEAEMASGVGCRPPAQYLFRPTEIGIVIAFAIAQIAWCWLLLRKGRNNRP